MQATNGCGEDLALQGIKSIMSEGVELLLLVRSGSMRPTVKAGERVVVRKIRPNTLRRGDIVALWNNERYLIHRVKQFNADRVVTKGDANRYADASMPTELIVGRIEGVHGHKGYRDLLNGWGRQRDRLCSGVAFLKLLTYRGQCLIAQVMILTRNVPLLRYLWVSGYRAAVSVITHSLRRVKGVESIYMSRGMASGHLTPGASDIDLVMVLTEGVGAVIADARAAALEKVKIVRSVCPLIGWVWILTPTQLSFYSDNGGFRASQALGWRRLSGPDLRSKVVFKEGWALFVSCLLEIQTNLHVLSRSISTLFSSPHGHLSAFVHIQKMLIDLLRIRAILSSSSEQAVLIPLARPQVLPHLGRSEEHVEIAVLAQQVEELFSAPWSNLSSEKLLRCSLRILQSLSREVQRNLPPLIEPQDQAPISQQACLVDFIEFPENETSVEALAQVVSELSRPSIKPALLVTPALHTAYFLVDVSGMDAFRLSDLERREIHRQLAAELLFAAMGHTGSFETMRACLILKSSIAGQRGDPQVMDILEALPDGEPTDLRRALTADYVRQMSGIHRHDKSLTQPLLKIIEQLEHALSIGCATL
jgi:signal peptidase I